MQDKIPDALIAAFERHYSLDWNDPAMRNERLAWRAAWAEATKPCLQQIQEAAATQAAQPIAWPKDAQDVRDFFRTDFITAQFAAKDRSPCDEDRYLISTHDFLSAVNRWADFPHIPHAPHAAPAAVAVPDERAAFERELIDNHHYVPSDFSFKDGFYGGDDDYIQFGWDVWQARAALDATPANCDSLEQLNGNNDLPAAAPVVLPEPDFWVRPGATIHPDRGWQCWSNDGTATGAFHVDTVRALLATATGLPAQACIATLTVDSCGNVDYETAQAGWLLPEGVHPLYAAPQAQADARDDAELLDAMERQRIAVVPEYEGPWDAEIYNDEGQPNHHGTGSTPREAIRAAIAASKE